jgi:hypothetical protein
MNLFYPFWLIDFFLLTMVHWNRVTRLGEFSPIASLFTLGSLYENYSNSPKLWATFSTVKFMRECVGLHFG